MERVSKRKCISKFTSHTTFLDDALINSEIKQGEWQNLLSDLLVNTSEIKSLFTELYNLDDTIVNRLEFGCITKINNNGNKKWVIIDGDEINLNATFFSETQ